MKKPSGKAEAGWYDAPETEGYLQYWNGKFWTKKKQVKDGYENLEVLPDYELGKLLFRSPIMSDGIFIAYLVLAGFTIVYLIIDYLEFVSGTTSVSLLIPAIGITLLWIYIIFLLVLIPRRIIDKKRGITKSVASKDKNAILTDDTSLVQVKYKNRNKYLFAICATIVVILIAVFSNSKSLNQNQGDEYFEVEQRISKVIREWNVAATPISEAVQLISNGQMDAAQARQIDVFFQAQTTGQNRARSPNTSGRGYVRPVVKRWCLDRQRGTSFGNVYTLRCVTRAENPGACE